VALRIEKTFQISGPIEKVWAFLSDPRRVAPCVPGAKITDQLDEKTYKGTISVKVGPAVSDYSGELQILRIDCENYEIELLGKGQDVRGRGSASMKMTGKLRVVDGGKTEMTSVSEVNLVGIVAQMGARVITEVSNVMFGQFTINLLARLQQPEGASDAPGAEFKPVKATSVAWEAGKRLFRRES
jgi:carbon monoxide dehydrogenase subunit G